MTRGQKSLHFLLAVMLLFSSIGFAVFSTVAEQNERINLDLIYSQSTANQPTAITVSDSDPFML